MVPFGWPTGRIVSVTFGNPPYSMQREPFAHVPRASQYYRVHWKFPLLEDSLAIVDLIETAAMMMNDIFAADPFASKRIHPNFVRIHPDLEYRIRSTLDALVASARCQAEYELVRIP